jgi:putative restriction endonuclease
MATGARPPTAFAAITDREWLEHLRDIYDLDEVNFWQPSPHGFVALQPGEPFIFKLRTRDGGQAAGLGFFLRYTRLPVSMAWEAFGRKNGASSLVQMRQRIERYRRTASPTYQDYEIGCVMLANPIFFAETDRFQLPDWPANIQVGRTYRLDVEPGRSLWARLEALTATTPNRSGGLLLLRESGSPRYGAPSFVEPRLGQGSFQTAVLDAYGRRCAVTGEKVVPTLEAAHIRDYADGGEHRVDNGLLLRRDVHALFDRGYMTVTPELDVVVSQRLKADFNNGADYLALHGSRLRHTSKQNEAPNPEFLDWHNQNRFVA